MILAFDYSFPEGNEADITRRRLFRIRGTEFTVVRDASDRELADYDDASAQLFDFGRGDELLIASEATYEELFDAVVVVHNGRAAKDSGTVDHFANALTMNRRLVSYLSARRLYLDYAQARITRRYGDPSPELQAFNAFRSELNRPGIVGGSFS